MPECVQDHPLATLCGIVTAAWGLFLLANGATGLEALYGTLSGLGWSMACLAAEA